MFGSLRGTYGTSLLQISHHMNVSDALALAHVDMLSFRCSFSSGLRLIRVLTICAEASEPRQSELNREPNEAGGKATGNSDGDRDRLPPFDRERVTAR